MANERSVATSGRSRRRHNTGIATYFRFGINLFLPLSSDKPISVLSLHCKLQISVHLFSELSRQKKGQIWDRQYDMHHKLTSGQTYFIMGMNVWNNYMWQQQNIFLPINIKRPNKETTHTVFSAAKLCFIFHLIHRPVNLRLSSLYQFLDVNKPNVRSHILSFLWQVNEIMWKALFCGSSCYNDACVHGYLDCVNVNSDEECETRANDMQCVTDPRYMLTYCRRTCTLCDQQQPGTNTVSQNSW